MNSKFLGISLLALLTLAGCTSYNRGMYKVNKTVDKYTLKPVAKAYKAVTPDPVEHGVSNFFSNLGEVGTTVNSLLQGKFHNAAVSSSRFVWNTTLGIGGIFDVASTMDLKANDEDFGQTLRTWGVPAGPYVVLPILGPSTATDTVGLVGDYFTSPVTYVDHDVTRWSLVGAGAVNTRAELLGLEKTLENASTDEYTFVKNAYLQKREAQVRDGATDEAVDDAFDEIFGD